MANITCKFDFSDFDRFKGCDGKPLSNELLEAQLKQSEEREDYEDCVIIRDELLRREQEYQLLTKSN